MTNWSTTLVTAPAIEPLTLEETKKFIRVEHTDEDALISSLITTARIECERSTGFAMIKQTWNLHLDDAPAGAWIYIPKPPLIEIEEFSYVDAEGLPIVVPIDRYAVDTASIPGRLETLDGWPDVTWSGLNPIVIRFVAGYGENTTDVPEDKRQGMLLRVSDLYEHRETVFPGHTLGMLDVIERLWADRTFHF